MKSIPAADTNASADSGRDWLLIRDFLASPWGLVLTAAVSALLYLVFALHVGRSSPDRSQTLQYIARWGWTSLFLATLLLAPLISADVVSGYREINPAAAVVLLAFLAIASALGVATLIASVLLVPRTQRLERFRNFLCPLTALGILALAYAASWAASVGWCEQSLPGFSYFLFAAHHAISGTSVVLSLLIRFFCAAFAIWACVEVLRRFATSKSMLTAELLAPPSSDDPASRTETRPLLENARRIRSLFTPSKEALAALPDIVALYDKLTLRRVLRRSLLVSIAFTAFTTLLSFLIFGEPDSRSAPVRGSFGFFMEKLSILLSEYWLILLLSLCVVVHRYCVRDILEPCIRLFQSGTNGRFESASVSALRVLGLHAQTVSSTVIYPFSLLALLALSRMSVIDNWSWSPQLAISFALGILAVYYFSFQLNTRVAALRRALIDDVDQQIQDSPFEDTRSRYFLKEQRSHLESLQTGAFGPWYRQSVFAVWPILLGAFGLIASIEPALTFLRAI